MPGRSGVTVVTMLVCLFYFACEAAGALGIRHSLRPLFSRGETVFAQLGRIAPRERGFVSDRRSAGRAPATRPAKKNIRERCERGGWHALSAKATECP